MREGIIWVCEYAEKYLKILMQKFLEKKEYLDSLQKNTQIEKKKNRLNRSSDDGDIIDLKSALLLENFVRAGQ